MTDSPDLRLELKVKNNTLWHAIYDQFASVSALCRTHAELKHQMSEISTLLRFKMYPFKKDPKSAKAGKPLYSDQYRKVCLTLERVLRVPVEDLFPRHLYENLVDAKTEKVVEINSISALPAATRREILALPAPVEESPEALVDLRMTRSLIEKMLKPLPYRYREVIRLSFGLFDGYEYDDKEIASIFKISDKKVRRIRVNAIRNLRDALSKEQELTFFP